MNENENKIVDPVEGGTDNDLDLLKKIKEIQENTVSKEEYAKLQAKYKEVVNNIVDGVGSKGEAEDTVDLAKIRENLFTDKVETLSNREFWKNVLQLRHERLEKEGVDIFLPKGSKTRYTREDYESAQKVDDEISKMLEDSEENPQLFSVLFNEALN